VVDASMAVVYAFMLKLAMIVLLCLRTPQPISTSRFCGFIHVLVVMSTFLLHVIILADLPYDVTEFIDCISNAVDVLTSLYPGVIICVLGDYNQLNTTFLQCEFGLT